MSSLAEHFQTLNMNLLEKEEEKNTNITNLKSPPPSGRGLMYSLRNLCIGRIVKPVWNSSSVSLVYCVLGRSVQHSLNNDYLSNGVLLLLQSNYLFLTHHQLIVPVFCFSQSFGK